MTCPKGQPPDRRTGSRALNPHCRRLADLASPSVVAPLVAHYWNRRRMRRVRAFRTLRLADNHRSALGRRPVSLMARLKSDTRRRVLGAPARLHNCNDGRRYRNCGRRHCHPTGLPPQTACNRLPRGAGRAKRGRRRQSCSPVFWERCPTQPIHQACHLPK